MIQQRVDAIPPRYDAAGDAPRRQHARLQPGRDRSRWLQLMWGALLPGREGGLLNARLRYFDPDRKRAGVPDDVAALVSELVDTRTVVTLVNLGTEPRSVIVQGGAHGEHQLISVTSGGTTTPVERAAAEGANWRRGCGQQLVLEMKRYANVPTVLHPWQR